MVADTLNCIDRQIGYFMVEQKINQEQMAALMEMSTNTLRWKREGKSKWTWEEILRLADLTGKSPDELSGFPQLITA